MSDVVATYWPYDGPHMVHVVDTTHHLGNRVPEDGEQS